MHSTARCGFIYDLTARHKGDGRILSLDQAMPNRVPLEGLDDMANTYLKGGVGPAALYIGLWSGAHVPDGSETAATLLTLVSEVTNYVQPARLLLELGAVSAGSCSNAADLARFDMLGAQTVNGAFLSTTAAKGANTGKILSVVRFANPRAVDETVYLEVLSGFQFISL